MTHKIANNLNKRFSSVLDGLTFDEWSEKIVDDITPDTAPIDLSLYFPLRKIKEVRINPSLSFPARIFIERNEFIVEIKYNVKWDKNSWSRFLIAHEIAHTFQYNIHNGQLIQQAFFLPGSSEAEYFSNRIARTMLVPRKLLSQQFNDKLQITNGELSLKLFNELTEQFAVDYKIILERIINDLEILKNVIIVRFVKLLATHKWKVIENFRSNKYYYDVKYYVPFRFNEKTNSIEEKSISCGMKLGSYLNSINDELLPDNEIRKDISADNLIDTPLSTFMKNFKNVVFYNCIVSKKKVPEGDVINMLIQIR